MIFNMDSSMVSLIYVAALVAFFLVLVVLTITIIASRSKSDEAEDIEGEEEFDIDNDVYEDEEDYDTDNDTSYSEEEYNIDNGTAEDIEDFGDRYEHSSFADTLDGEASTDSEHKDENPKDDVFAEAEREADGASAETKHEAVKDVDNEDTTEGSEDKNGLLGDETDELPEIPEEFLNMQKSDDNEEEGAAEGAESVFEDSAFVDSAFAPEPIGATLTNEALNESVREAVALGDAVSRTGSIPVFGVAEALDRGTKKRGNGKEQSKSSVSSTDEFYWYNKADVAEKPSYKTAEMYYHYFNLPKDCIESLVIEMYDCALVRTEEIRYIAYGIEPRAVSMKEILTSGNHNYIQQKKQKEPAEQDLVRIYEKWCGYVDKLFDVVEIHADKFTIDEIRSLLYEFGRNDVDILIEGM